MITRRIALFGLLASPAIIRTPGLLMAIKKPSKLYMLQVSGVLGELHPGMIVTGGGLPESKIISVSYSRICPWQIDVLLMPLG